mmetsp:Transcript_65841/g.177902  ORF Transcript_65841/g.177902 Transcript_65841/m.177902 type:complete len:294 (-) Transcript_65841:567-1448(-)
MCRSWRRACTTSRAARSTHSTPFRQRTLLRCRRPRRPPTSACRSSFVSKMRVRRQRRHRQAQAKCKEGPARQAIRHKPIHRSGGPTTRSSLLWVNVGCRLSPSLPCWWARRKMIQSGLAYFLVGLQMVACCFHIIPSSLGYTAYFPRAPSQKTWASVVGGAWQPFWHPVALGAPQRVVASVPLHKCCFRTVRIKQSAICTRATASFHSTRGSFGSSASYVASSPPGPLRCAGFISSCRGERKDHLSQRQGIPSGSMARGGAPYQAMVVARRFPPPAMWKRTTCSFITRERWSK